MAITGRSIPNVPYVARNSLADDPVLTTTGPIVSTVPGKRGKPNVALLRGSLADDPVLTTQPAIVVAAPARRSSPVVFVSRSSTEVAAAPTAATPQPLVVVPVVKPRAGGIAFTRGTLADDPVLTTQPAIVVAAPVRRTSAVVFVSRSSTEDAVVATAATPTPLVIVPAVRPRPGVATALRNTLDDDPVLTTPPALVVTAPTRPRVATVAVFRSSTEDVVVSTVGTPQPVSVTYQPKPRPGVATLIRSSLQDDATPQALVFTTPGRRPGAVIRLSRGSLIDDAVLTTTGPIVVAAPRSRPPGTVAVFHNPPEAVAHSCSTDRPDTGVTARPGTGVTSYALAMTARPSSGITARPNTGTTTDPC